ncbi:MAG: hypothetical protein M0R03_15495 [Novosphingobium sp.]|nr:hypothetical protein [Novosphingobium sp.]
MDVELFKKSFEIKNETECKVFNKLIDAYYPNIIVFKNKDIPDVDYCINNYKGENVLILEAENPNLSEKGNHLKTEFCLITKDSKQIWIDAKQQKTLTNLYKKTAGEIVLDAVNCNGDFYYICDGLGYTSHVITQLDTYAKNKELNVKVLPLSKFDDLLKSL